ncbi:MAG: hypothetical protein LUF30_12680, partial [Lachnospiraceae bacterium]|nr:hypothetical protein [Lachnospiraceae bacterium]
VEMSDRKVDQEEDSVLGDVKKTEDAIMKNMMQFFADEMLPIFGISKKVKALAPAEEVHVEIRRGLQDFNLVMADNSIAHFEFQSTNGGRRDLRRFRSYEADVSYQLQRPVTTYVLFSGKVRAPMSEILEGINTYKIVPIIMSKQNADSILDNLRKKQSAGEPLTREDLVFLPMLPLMNGKTSQKDRIKSAYRITKDAEGMSHEEVRVIESAVYAMATKFLDKKALEEIKGEFNMNIFGELIQEGLEKGRQEILYELVEKKWKKGKSAERIADELEQDVSTVKDIIEKITEEQAVSV